MAFFVSCDYKCYFMLLEIVKVSSTWAIVQLFHKLIFHKWQRRDDHITNNNSDRILSRVSDLDCYKIIVRFNSSSLQLESKINGCIWTKSQIVSLTQLNNRNKSVDSFIQWLFSIPLPLSPCIGGCVPKTSIWLQMNRPTFSRIVVRRNTFKLYNSVICPFAQMSVDFRNKSTIFSFVTNFCIVG